jgi:GDP-L-fucose synthase
VSHKTRIILTGGSGMVGKNFLQHPGILEFEVIAPTHHELDLLRYDDVLAFVRQCSADFVIHCAGRVGGIQANIENPVAFLVENLDMARNVILASRRAKVPQLINLGSSCMYPRDATNPLREEQILTGELEPTNEGYALAKIAAARLCEYIGREDPDLRYKTLIPCNIYGPHDDFDPVSSHLIPAVIHKLHNAKVERASEIFIWGDGTARREFMYVGDLADCLVRAVRHFESLPDVMNVGLGYDYTINEYYEETAKVVGYMGGFKHDVSKPVGMTRKLVSTKRADQWGWRPKCSLREGLIKTYKYYLNRRKSDG